MLGDSDWTGMERRKKGKRRRAYLIDDLLYLREGALYVLLRFENITPPGGRA